MLGGYQLAPLVQRFPEPFANRYTAELLDYRETLITNSLEGARVEVAGLQLALATQFQDDAKGLRSDLLKGLVLSTLTQRGPSSHAMLAKGVSDLLRLPRPIRPEYLNDVLRELSDERLVEHNDDQYLISQLGRDRYTRSQELGVLELGRGKEIIRRTLASLLGEELDPQTYNALWRRIQDELANLFFSHGIKIVQLIASLISDERRTSQSRTFAEMLNGMKHAIAAAGVGGARTEDVAQAVVDLFEERESEAFKWLTELAVRYVSLCSLGLEPNAQQAIATQLGSIDLIVDTDVVLSFLSQGERPHLV